MRFINKLYERLHLSLDKHVLKTENVYCTSYYFMISNTFCKLKNAYKVFISLILVVTIFEIILGIFQQQRAFTSTYVTRCETVLLQIKNTIIFIFMKFLD